ncbi:CU044_5270 family protein [Actinomadura xylanilytica]|uniref:CU044_5270 family protein n=1 Tax=Actinomadura xylanilytica TaxID=887459 RepID=UPI00255A9362|nr:CU044_5270 family protein [Actinomadura xylanilytica]MDL4771943.1 CU044_5270 family protein [Actinomadura xylanilytica]
MNDLKMIKEWRAGTPPMPAAMEESIRARLGALATGAEAPRRRPRRSYRRPVLGALLAGGVAAAVGITLLGGDPGDGPQDGMSARTVLLSAAEKAQRQPETTGRYWHTVTNSKFLLGSLATSDDGPPRFRMYERKQLEYWASPNPERKDWSATTNLGMEPVIKADEDAWKRLKCPDFLMPAPGDGDCTTMLKPGRRKIETGDLNYSFVNFDGKKVTFQQIADLPTDPVRLREALNRLLGYKAGDEKVFELGTGLVSEAPAPPRVRAAAFRMIAELPSVRTLGELTDPLGRKGTAVALKVSRDAEAVETRLIVDPAAGRALTSYSVALNNGDGLHGTGIKTGEIQTSSSVIEAGWTNSHP